MSRLEHELLEGFRRAMAALRREDRASAPAALMSVLYERARELYEQLPDELRARACAVVSLEPVRRRWAA